MRERKYVLQNLLSNWHFYDLSMVRRMIGIHDGTLSQHYAFREITDLIERSKLPVLPNVLKEMVSFRI